MYSTVGGYHRGSKGHVLHGVGDVIIKLVLSSETLTTTVKAHGLRGQLLFIYEFSGGLYNDARLSGCGDMDPDWALARQLKLMVESAQSLSFWLLQRTQFNRCHPKASAKRSLRRLST
jgi:hypothetical protein